MNEPNSRIAVLGAGGQTGQAVVEALRQGGARVRAVVRREEHAGRFAEGVEVATADLGDAGAVAAAIRSCAAVYHVPPSFNEGEERFAANIIAAMAAGGASRLVYHSVLHAPTPNMPHHQRKSRVELMIRESDLEWTILQPAMYVQTALSFLSGDRRMLRPPFDPDRPFNVIALPDLAAAIVAVLGDPATAFGTFELAGTERLSLRLMAAELSRVLGHPVGVEASDMEEQVEIRARKRGWSPAQQEEYRAMLRYYGRHGLAGNGLTLEMLLGRPATPFAEAARALLAA